MIRKVIVGYVRDNVDFGNIEAQIQSELKRHIKKDVIFSSKKEAGSLSVTPVEVRVDVDIRLG